MIARQSPNPNKGPALMDEAQRIAAEMAAARRRCIEGPLKLLIALLEPLSVYDRALLMAFGALYCADPEFMPPGYENADPERLLEATLDLIETEAYAIQKAKMRQNAN
jgi:hypothetical protein